MDGDRPTPSVDGCPKAGDTNEGAAPVPKLRALADPEPNTGVVSFGAATISRAGFISSRSGESGGVGCDRIIVSKGSAGSDAIPCILDAWEVQNASELF